MKKLEAGMTVDCYKSPKYARRKAFKAELLRLIHEGDQIDCWEVQPLDTGKLNPTFWWIWKDTYVDFYEEKKREKAAKGKKKKKK